MDLRLQMSDEVKINGCSCVFRILSEAEIDTHLVALSEREWRNWPTWCWKDDERQHKTPPSSAVQSPPERLGRIWYQILEPKHEPWKRFGLFYQATLALTTHPSSVVTARIWLDAIIPILAPCAIEGDAGHSKQQHTDQSNVLPGSSGAQRQHRPSLYICLSMDSVVLQLLESLYFNSASTLYSGLLWHIPLIFIFCFQTSLPHLWFEVHALFYLVRSPRSNGGNSTIMTDITVIINIVLLWKSAQVNINKESLNFYFPPCVFGSSSSLRLL